MLLGDPDARSDRHHSTSAAVLDLVRPVRMIQSALKNR